MSLLDTGNETILVYAREHATDDRGNKVWQPATTPVEVHCRVQIDQTAEPTVPGQATTTTYRVIARTAPLGPWARVDWQGRAWDVIGEVRHYNGSANTRHVDALIRARTTSTEREG